MAAATSKRKKNNTLKYLLWSVGILVVLIILGRAMGWIGQEKLTEVYTSKAKLTEIVEKVTSSGKIQPETEVKISPEVSGEIVEVLIKEGDSVQQGQLLVRIRPDILRDVVEGARANFNVTRSNLAQTETQLLQRQAELARSKTEFDRAKKLFEEKVTSEIDFLQAKTNYEVLQQQVTAAQRSIDASRYNTQNSQANLNQNINNLARTEIYAPINGTISKLAVEKGEKVVGTAQMAGTEMLRLANLTVMEVEVDVNENDIIKVKRGQRVVIEVDSYASMNRKFEGIVTEIANTANNTISADAVTEFKVKIRMLNESYKDLQAQTGNLSPFRPGMTASVEVITQKKEKVLSVPISAVTTRNLDEKNEKDANKTTNTNTEQKKRVEKIKQYVFVYNSKEEKSELREVETGASDFENIEILKGLKEGDEVIVGPYNVVTKTLKDKQKIKKTTKK
ncbi:MAG: efflux RND transporter periplasmic adaptor subunit [Bacteroidetes bacterium]|nr:MAG: efflux RND transporter periplasmic adaptor subunit [Bacteroidota bacterium]